MVSIHSSCIEAFGLGKGGVASIVGAGGKTSLVFQLAAEARSLGFKVLVSTTTKMFVPDRDQYDYIDLAGHGFVGNAPQLPGIYVAGRPVSSLKMAGISEDDLLEQSHYFDLVLLEADGAARKPLKGWLDTEPVVPACTTHTIGVVDIQTVGKIVDEDLVHRLDCFYLLTGAQRGESVTVEHLKKLITHEKGLFFHALGKKIVCLNKVESSHNQRNAALLKTLLPGRSVCTGSVRMKQMQGSRKYL